TQDETVRATLVAVLFADVGSPFVVLDFLDFLLQITKGVLDLFDLVTGRAFLEFERDDMAQFAFHFRGAFRGRDGLRRTQNQCRAKNQGENFHMLSVNFDVETRTVAAGLLPGKRGYSGDGGPALQADLNEPYEVRFDSAGNMFFAEMQNHVVRRMDAGTHLISTVAGTGVAGFAGDGGPASQAMLRQPHSIAFGPQGRLL